MNQNAVIIDAATRFLRSNPELLEFARRGAGETGQPVDHLLSDAVRRIRRSGFESIAKEEVVAGPPYRLKRRAREIPGGGGPSVDETRPRLVVVAPRDSGRDSQEELMHRLIG
jgi:hypothetical protein